MKDYFFCVLFCLAFILLSCKQHENTQTKDSEKPNIIIIYSDDVGYADVGVYGARGVKTPAIDRLAQEGVMFTDAHCTAATCTPSRYSLLTGSYAFRNNAAILPGDAPLLIDTDMETLPKMFQKNGYQTGVIGKWHLGLGRGMVDWNQKIIPGPAEIGFDYSFLLPATGDRVPTVYLENQQVVNLDPMDPIEVSYEKKIGERPTGLERPDLLKMGADDQHSQSITNGISRIGFMKGGENALWKDEDMADELTGKMKAFIKNRGDKPFFLYYALHDIHVPRVPHERFSGKSTMGPRGDVITQMDWCVAQVMEVLESEGISGNTILIFTSDNGPVLDDGYDDNAVKLVGDHSPSGIFRGGKYSAYEAGTRVPTIIRWPDKIKKGSVKDNLLTQVDLYATFAKLIGHSLLDGEAPDSFEMLDSWLGESQESRPYILEESFVFSVRKGEWKYITTGNEAPDWLSNKDIESGMGIQPQLYRIDEDITEQNNLIDQFPEIAFKLQKLFEEIKIRPTREGG